jgi:hypothetical protein
MNDAKSMVPEPEQGPDRLSAFRGTIRNAEFTLTGTGTDIAST